MGWDIESTPVLNMLAATETREPDPKLPTPFLLQELLSTTLRRAAEQFTERESHARTPLAAWPDEPPIWAATVTAPNAKRREPGTLQRVLSHLLADWCGTQAEVVVAPRRIHITSPGFRSDILPLSPVRAAKELKMWTGLTWTQLAAAVGINEGTLHYWRRVPDASPRPSTVTALYEAHSLAKAARSQLGGDSQLRLWLHRADEDVAPEQALRAGDLKAFRAQVQQLTFGPPETRPVATSPAEGAWFDEPELPPTTPTPTEGLRRAGVPRPRAQLP